jgi:hypothetical protein
MDINTRLMAIEENQKLILDLLVGKKTNISSVMTLKDAAQYTGYSVDHFRRLAVEQRLIPYSRPSEQQKGKLLFRKIDLDHFDFVEKAIKVENAKRPLGRKRKSTF